MAAFLDKLPAEMRQMIYIHLLQFEAPLKRVGSVTERNSCIKRYKESAKTPVTVDVAILFTCKAIHFEARPFLFALNTIGLSHDDLCLSNRFVCRKPWYWRFVTKAILFDRPKSDPNSAFTLCPDCGTEPSGFLDIFTRGKMKKLKSVKIVLETNDKPIFKNDMQRLKHYINGNFKQQRRQLRRDGMRLRFTSPGCFSVTLPRALNVDFEYGDLASVWPDVDRCIEENPTRALAMVEESNMLADPNIAVAATSLMRFLQINPFQEDDERNLYLSKRPSEYEKWEKGTDFILFCSLLGNESSDEVVAQAAARLFGES